MQFSSRTAKVLRLLIRLLPFLPLEDFVVLLSADRPAFFPSFYRCEKDCFLPEVGNILTLFRWIQIRNTWRSAVSETVLVYRKVTVGLNVSQLLRGFLVRCENGGSGRPEVAHDRRCCRGHPAVDISQRFWRIVGRKRLAPSSIKVAAVLRRHSLLEG